MLIYFHPALRLSRILGGCGGAANFSLLKRNSGNRSLPVHVLRNRNDVRTVAGHLKAGLNYGEANVAILIFCSKCGASLRVKDECAGQVGICPKCKGPIFIASPADETVLSLP